MLNQQKRRTLFANVESNARRVRVSTFTLQGAQVADNPYARGTGLSRQKEEAERKAWRPTETVADVFPRTVCVCVCVKEQETYVYARGWLVRAGCCGGSG